MIHFLINPSAGAARRGATGERLEARIQARCPGAAVAFVEDGSDVERLARDALARGASTVVAGGGDGTVRAVASALAGTDAVLGILPLGTLNHFARDLGIPTDLDGALGVVAAGRPIAVDVGEVSGRVFVNNSGLGLYPAIVRGRESRRRGGLSKWLAALIAAARALLGFRHVTILVEVDGRRLVRRTRVVFVGNNEYRMDGWEAGTRSCLDSGRLSLYIPHHRSRVRLAWFVLKALAGRGRRDPYLDAVLTAGFRIDTGGHRPHVTLDGELVRLDPPLEYRIRPRALRVLAPGDGPPSGAEVEMPKGW